MNSWRDPEFRYLGAATHADASKFRRRQQERRRQAQALAAETAKKVQPMVATNRQAKV